MAEQGACLQCGGEAPRSRRFCAEFCRRAYGRRGRVPQTVSGQAATPVLGLDLSGTVGWAVLGLGPSLAGAGHFGLRARRSGEPRADWLVRRAADLGVRLLWLLQRYEPATLAYEYLDRPFHRHWGGQRRVTPGSEFNAAWGLGRAEGMLAVLVANLIPPEGRPPLRLVAIHMEEAKRATCGNANAGKQMVRDWLTGRYGWEFEGEPHDTSDAAAVALAALEGRP